MHEPSLRGRLSGVSGRLNGVRPRIARGAPGGVDGADEGRGVTLTCAPIRRALE